MNDDRVSERLDQVIQQMGELRGEVRAMRLELDTLRRGPTINYGAVYLAIFVALILIGTIWLGAMIR